jgi:hypothetical protein
VNKLLAARHTFRAEIFVPLILTFTTGFCVYNVISTVEWPGKRLGLQSLVATEMNLCFPGL